MDVTCVCLYGLYILWACYGQVVFVYGYVWGVHGVSMLWVGCVNMGIYCVECLCCGHVMGQLPVCSCECVVGRLLSSVCMWDVYYVGCVCCGQVVSVWECVMCISCGAYVYGG